MNKILKLVSIGFFAVFLTVFLSTGTTQASFFDWFSLNKASNDSQQAAAVAKTKTPTISNLSPSQGTANTRVTIYGTNLSGASSVEFYTSSGQFSASLVPSSISAKKVVFIISEIFAANMPPGMYQVGVVTNTCAGGCNSNQVGFTLTASSSSSSRSSKSSSSKSSKSSATTTSVYMLKVNKSGKGYVSDGGRLNCGTACSEKYWPGSEVKLTASPYGGYVFEKFVPEKECTSIYTDSFGFNDNQWIKQAFAYRDGENVVCVTTMNKSKTITAIFKKISNSSSSKSKSKSSSSRSSKSSSSRSSRSSATTTPSNV